MPPQRNDILQGTLMLLVLRTLASQRRMHGYAITSHIQRVSTDLLRVEEGSLYPALQKLLLNGWVKASWTTSESGREVREYRLTAAGRKQLEAELADYRRTSRAIGLVLDKA
jgi:transcriptional regulator